MAGSYPVRLYVARWLYNPESGLIFYLLSRIIFGQIQVAGLTTPCECGC